MERSTYWLTRWLLLRGLAFIYLVAFVSLWWQLVPLFGAHGILPVKIFLHDVDANFWQLPSLFWWNASDGFMRAMCVVGLALSAAVLAGVTNAIVMAALWFLYLSFVHVGQIFYGYGWEILLLEAGFLGIFLCPLRKWRPFASAPSTTAIWLFRWLLFRVMLGAGLIKIRGDSCWRDLTCLVYHYETQPIPNPLSWLANQAPRWFHELGVLFNHLVELIAPFCLFWPRRLAIWAAAVTALFQFMLILSGNLSFLNWLTLVLCIACVDDRAWQKLLRRTIPSDAPTNATRVAGWVLCVVVGVLSIGPVTNLFSREQVMNDSFDRLHLVNTYGAFGSVGRVRREVVLEGSYDRVSWREYQFPCAPGDVTRRPCVIAPLQPRLDWQIWFAAMSSIEHEPWLLRLVYKLLEGDQQVLTLMGPNPFDRGPPRYIRARLYEYHFTRFGQPGWWTRTLVGEYMPPVDLKMMRQIVADD